MAVIITKITKLLNRSKTKTITYTPNLISRARLRQPVALAVIIIVAVSGVRLLQGTSAVNSPVAIESEAGVLSNPAALGSASDASGGKYVKFGSGAPSGPAFYMSPGGSDSNPGTQAAPFLTISKAQSAVDGSSTTKTVYLMGGTYNISSMAMITGGAWLGYPGQTPILNGVGPADTLLHVSGSGTTVKGLTVTNAPRTGIIVQNATDVLIENNTVKNTKTPDWNGSAIIAATSLNRVTIRGNLVDGTGWMGISISDMEGDSISNVTVENNALYNTCLTVADCSAIYDIGRGYSQTGINISNNLIVDYGVAGTVGHAIYLDDFASNVTVTNNIVYGTGEYAIQIHGGDHNLFQNNIFDLSNGDYLASYMFNDPNKGMANNVFTCNITWSSASGRNLWQLVDGGDVIALPSVYNNIYSTNFGTKPTTDTIKDSSPILSNPGFINPGAHNYNFTSAPPAPCFQPIDTSGIPPRT